MTIISSVDMPFQVLNAVGYKKGTADYCTQVAATPAKCQLTLPLLFCCFLGLSETEVKMARGKGRVCSCFFPTSIIKSVVIILWPCEAWLMQCDCQSKVGYF
mgnify:CR=1 FL=1